MKETFQDGMERKRTILSEEVTERLTSSSEIWNVTKRKRSGGGRMRSANVRQDFTGDAPVITLTPDMYGKCMRTYRWCFHSILFLLFMYNLFCFAAYSLVYQQGC